VKKFIKTRPIYFLSAKVAGNYSEKQTLAGTVQKARLRKVKLKQTTYRELRDEAHRNIGTEWGRGLLKIVNAALDHDPKKLITTAEFSLRLWDAFNAGVDYGRRVKKNG